MMRVALTTGRRRLRAKLNLLEAMRWTGHGGRTIGFATKLADHFRHCTTLGFKTGAEFKAAFMNFFEHIKGNHAKCTSEKCQTAPAGKTPLQTSAAWLREVEVVRAKFDKRLTLSDCEKWAIGLYSSIMGEFISLFLSLFLFFLSFSLSFFPSTPTHESEQECWMGNRLRYVTKNHTMKAGAVPRTAAAVLDWLAGHVSKRVADHYETTISEEKERRKRWRRWILVGAGAWTEIEQA